ncbi:hypothetical protein DMENIID0001_011310 [Sergentomyia squamirostris]
MVVSNQVNNHPRQELIQRPSRNVSKRASAILKYLPIYYPLCVLIIGWSEYESTGGKMTSALSPDAPDSLPSTCHPHDNINSHPPGWTI